MNKLIYILATLIIISGNIFSQQSYINYVLGKYIGSISRDGCPNVASSPGSLYLLTSTNYSFTVREDDSSGLGMFGEPWEIQVFADSTLASYNGSGATGRLYSNDSIHLTVFLFGSTWCHRTFNGFKLYSTVGVNDLSKQENELLISPQPANDVVYIQSTQLVFRQEDIPIIYDISGKQYTIPIQYINKNTYKLDVSNLSGGIYVVAIKTENVIVRKKMIVQ
jgi:hypothetical protein